MSTHGRPRRARSAPLKMREAADVSSSDDEMVVESPAAAEARALAADPAAIREVYARDLRHDGGDRPAKDTAVPSCGGVGSLAATGRLGTLLEPLGDGSARLGLACCVARGVIKYGSLRCMTIEKLGDYVSRGEAVYEHLGPKSKPHVDFVQRLEAELKFKNQTRYFYGSMCHCHLDNVTSLLHRVEKKLSSAAPGAAQVVPGRAGGAEKRRAGPAQVSSDDDDPPADSSDEAAAATPEKRQRRDAIERERGKARRIYFLPLLRPAPRSI